MGEGGLLVREGEIIQYISFQRGAMVASGDRPSPTEAAAETEAPPRRRGCGGVLSPVGGIQRGREAPPLKSPYNSLRHACGVTPPSKREAGPLSEGAVTAAP